MTAPSIFTFALAGLFTAAATLIGGGVALRLKTRLAMLTAFGSGVIISVALLDLIPEALRLLESSVQPLMLMAKVAGGFAAYLMVDRLAAGVLTARPEQRGHMAPALLTLHSGMDGLAIGLSFQVSASAGWLVIVGVLAHDFIDGANSVILSISDGGNIRRARGWLIANAVAPGVGLVASLLVTVPAAWLAGSLAVFAGGFLYVGASELLPRSRAEGSPIVNGIITVLGFLAFYLVVLIASSKVA